MDSLPDYQISEHCYDPRFLLPLFLNLLEPHSVINCRSFAIGKSCLGYTLSCLSLYDRTMRAAAYAVLFRFRHHLRAQSTSSSKARFREKPQILYILNLLRQSHDRALVRIPSLSAAFLSRAVQLTAMPWNPAYSSINRYLLLKPRLDLRDVPEFYKLFQSSNPAERLWILNLMADGIREAADYRMCERRNAFRLLFAFYDWAAGCGSQETPARREILKIISGACRIGSAVADLCYRYNLIGWICGAVHSITMEDEATELVAILWSIHTNVLQKETTPEYVSSMWYGAAHVVREKALQIMESAGAETKLGKSNSWRDFSETLTNISAKFC